MARVWHHNPSIFCKGCVHKIYQVSWLVNQPPFMARVWLCTWHIQKLDAWTHDIKLGSMIQWNITQFHRWNFSSCREIWVENNLSTSSHTVDGRNPAPVEVGSLSPIIYRAVYIPGGAGFLASTVHPEVSCFRYSLWLKMTSSQFRCLDVYGYIVSESMKETWLAMDYS